MELDVEAGLSGRGKDTKSEIWGEAVAPDGDKRYFDSSEVISGYFSAVPWFTTWDDCGGGYGIVLRPGGRGDVTTLPNGEKEAASRDSG